MGLKKRAVFACLAAGWSYFIYIYVVEYIFNFIGDPNMQLGPADLNVGDIATLRYYIEFFGWSIVGLSFATQMAHKKTAPRQVWNLLRLFAGIVFWSMFIAAGLNEINISVGLSQVDLNIDLNLTLLFYAMMGGKIFAVALAVIDFFIAFVKEDEDKEKGTKVEITT